MHPNTTTIEDLVQELKKPGKAFLHPSTDSQFRVEIVKSVMIQDLKDYFPPRFYWVRTEAGLIIFYLNSGIN